MPRLFPAVNRRVPARATYWLALVITLLSANSQALQVIVNPSVTATELTKRELRAIYTMRLQHWSDGGEVQVFVLPQASELHQRFSKEVLEALPHQLQAVWYRLVYSGMGEAPVEVHSEQEMIERVRQSPGAIGYIENANDVSHVQVLNIEAMH